MCPVCGGPATSERVLRRPVRWLGVVEAHYVCVNGHGWLTEWSTAA